MNFLSNRCQGASSLNVSLVHFRNNIRILQSYLPSNTALCACLKCNSYGHGISELAAEALKNGVEWFGICSNSDAFDIHALSPERVEPVRIIRLRLALAAEVSESLALSLGVEECIGSLDAAYMLHELGLQHGRPLPVHINLDSGMGRAGFYFDTPEKQKDIEKLGALSGLKIVGIMTHFPHADEADITPTGQSLSRFVEWANYLKSNVKGFGGAMLHCASSAMALRMPESHLDMVRIGAALYGSRTSGEVPLPEGIVPVMTWKTNVLRVVEVPAGTSIGYGGLYTTDRVSRIASLPVGFGQGYPRLLTNKGFVLIRGHFCPVVGRVTLNSMTVLVPGDVQTGDEVVLLGQQNGQSIIAEDLAQTIGSVHTEIQMAGFFNSVKYSV